MIITLKTYDGQHYLSAIESANNRIVADPTVAQYREKFDIIGPLLYGGRIALRTSDYKYFLCAERGGGGELVLTSLWAKEYESFRIIGQGGLVDGSPVKNGDTISLQTYDKKHFVCAENGGGGEVVANRTSAHQWESFVINMIPSTITLPSTRIIHISDLHFSDSSMSPGDCIAAYLYKNASQLDANIVVITGDLTDNGNQDEYTNAWKFIQRLYGYGFYTYAIPGNHDYCDWGLLDSHGAIGGKDEARRQRFINQITNYFNPEFKATPKYPHTKEIGNYILVLLDSIQGQMDEDTDDRMSEGRLGEPQLKELNKMLNYLQYNRQHGKKVIICLHHSPLDSDREWGLRLVDWDRFMGIIENRIDCLLFGHIGDPQQSYSTLQNSYGIPIINSENLGNCDSSTIKITVVDLMHNFIEVYPTDISQLTLVTRGSQPMGITITPIVTKAETTYDGSDAGAVIKFLTGDKVTIVAGGGVQTGGWGDTWKRYVNPIGDNSDEMYFGTIYLPGITTSGLIPIRDLVGTYGGGAYYGQSSDECRLNLTIPDISSLPASARYLRLGYVDNNYSDNGYWGKDDGNDDQCKYVGNAYVKIMIKHAPPSAV